MKTTIIAAAAAVLAGQALSTYLIVSEAPASEEVFVDHMQQIRFDGSVMRLEMGASRVGKPSQGKPLPASRETVARVVLTPEAAMQLRRGMDQALLAYQPL